MSLSRAKGTATAPRKRESAASRKVRKLAESGTRAKAAFRPPPVGVWTTNAGFVYSVDSDTQKLMLFVSLQPHGAWGVMALTRPIAATTEEEVFQDHAHSMVGNYVAVVEALQAAETFAVAWLRKWKVTQARQAPACDCADIP
jgi:hypothetical protein